jgi:hypothetical protein
MGLLTKLVSGGQTGVDRAALDAGLRSGLAVGGWCPKGRLAEDGFIDLRYPLQETHTESYSVRTEWNVRDSDGTLILHREKLTGGTALTKRLAIEYERPCLCLQLSTEVRQSSVVRWLERHQLRTLNVAGPRESGEPGIYQQAYQFLMELLSRLKDKSSPNHSS